MLQYSVAKQKLMLDFLSRQHSYDAVSWCIGTERGKTADGTASEILLIVETLYYLYYLLMYDMICFIWFIKFEKPSML